jgi:hypothetical protein
VYFKHRCDAAQVFATLGHMRCDETCIGMAGKKHDRADPVAPASNAANQRSSDPDAPPVPRSAHSLSRQAEKKICRVCCVEHDGNAKFGGLVEE